MRLVFQPFRVFSISLLLLPFFCSSAAAENPIPKDTCILELTLPEGSTAKLDPASKMPVQALQTGHAAPITTAVFSHDGRYLATGDQVGHIAVWDTKNLRQVRSFSPEKAIGKDIFEVLRKDHLMPDESSLVSSIDNLHFSADDHYLGINEYHDRTLNLKFARATGLCNNMLYVTRVQMVLWMFCNGSVLLRGKAHV